MLKALLLAAALAACDGSYVTTTTPVAANCLEIDYQDPSCVTGYDWSVGYYDSYRVWHRPRYVRRTVYVAPPAVHVYIPPPRVYAPTVRTTVTTTRRITTAPVTRTRTTVTTTRRR